MNISYTDTIDPIILSDASQFINEIPYMFIGETLPIGQQVDLMMRSN